MPEHTEIYFLAVLAIRSLKWFHWDRVKVLAGLGSPRCFGRESVSMPFVASRHNLHSLARGPSSIFKAGSTAPSNLLSLWPLLPSSFSLVLTTVLSLLWLHWDYLDNTGYSLHLKILNYICNPPLVMSGNIFTNPGDYDMGMEELAGRGHYSPNLRKWDGEGKKYVLSTLMYKIEEPQIFS